GFSKETLKPLLDRMITLDLDVDRKSTRLNSSHVRISYAVFCLKKKNTSTKGWRRAAGRGGWGTRVAGRPAAAGRPAGGAAPPRPLGPRQPADFVFFLKLRAPHEHHPLPPRGGPPL